MKTKILEKFKALYGDGAVCYASPAEKYLKGVDFHYVENVADVWQFALTDEKVKKTTDFSIEENDKKE